MADPYADLAREVTDQPQVMQGLAEWFDSGKAKSAFQFGIALGKVDAADTVATRVVSWLEASRCPDLVAGYLSGLVSRVGELPAEWRQRLDQVAERHGEYAAVLTFQADRTLSGFRRVMRLVTSGRLGPRYLHGFALVPWPTVLGSPEKGSILDSLLGATETEPPSPTATALHLMVAWGEYGRIALPEDLLPQAVTVLRQSLGVRVDPGYWLILVRLLAPARPAEVVGIVLDALTSAWPSRVAVEQEAVTILADLAAAQPRQVMEAIGRILLDPDRRVWIHLVRLPGLMEAIGVDPVREWLDRNGQEHIKDLAPHLDSPRLDAGGPVIPAVTEWVLTRFEQDDAVFRAFCLGRHQLEARWGNARDRRADLEKFLEPFRDHPLRRVQGWVQYELQSNDQDAEFDEYHDEHERR